jgi:hypothetical protein
VAARPTAEHDARSNVMRALAWLIAIALMVDSGCVYGFKSLRERQANGGAAASTDASAESKRRSTRRWWALAGGAVELGLGALTRYAFSQSTDQENRALFGITSELLLMVGAGDVALATVDSALSTPFVDANGAFRPPSQFQARDVPPSPRVQADASAGVGYASQGRVESHYDVAVFHWLRPTLRLRYQLRFDRGAELVDGDVDVIYYGIGGGASLEWNPGAGHFGRHSKSALVLAALPRAVWAPDRAAQFGWRASVGWGFGRLVVAAGGTQIVGEDRLPGLEVWLAIRPVATD